MEGDSAAEILAKMVYSNPILWKSSHMHYRNRQMKDQVWREIGAKFGLDAFGASEKFRLLRQKYVKEKKRDMLDNRPKWHMMELMSFLEPEIIPRKSRQTLILDNSMRPKDCDYNSQFYSQLDNRLSLLSDEGSFLNVSQTSPAINGELKSGNYSFDNWSRLEPTVKKIKTEDQFSSILHINEEQDVEAFINMIRSNPIVWDVEHLHYRNKLLKDKIWADIGQRFGFDSAKAYDKFKLLRQKYYREKNKMKELEYNEMDLSKCHFLNLMSFLPSEDKQRRYKCKLEYNETQSQASTSQLDFNENSSEFSTYEYKIEDESNEEHSGTFAPLKITSVYSYEEKMNQPSINFKISTESLEMVNDNLYNSQSVEQTERRNSEEVELRQNFDEELTVLLIKLVENEPTLWQSTHVNYKNTELKEKIWDEIAQKLGTLGINAQLRFNNLRKKYFQLEKTDNCCDEKDVDSNLMKYLSFLDSQIIVQKCKIPQKCQDDKITSDVRKSTIISNILSPTSEFSNNTAVQINDDNIIEQKNNITVDTNQNSKPIEEPTPPKSIDTRQKTISQSSSNVGVITKNFQNEKPVRLSTSKENKTEEQFDLDSSSMSSTFSIVDLNTDSNYSQCENPHKNNENLVTSFEDRQEEKPNIDLVEKPINNLRNATCNRIQSFTNYLAQLMSDIPSEKLRKVEKEIVDLIDKHMAK